MTLSRLLLVAALAGGVLSGVGRPARANEADDEIQRLVDQLQDETANYSTDDVARMVDEVSGLVPHAGPKGVAAVGHLTERLNHMLQDAPPDPAAPAPPLPAEPPAEASVAAIPAPAQVPAPVPAPAPIPTELLDLLRRRGAEALRTGDISGARRYLGRAAEAGCAPCADAMARTYDARELRRIGATGTLADPALAEQWRNRAQQLRAHDAP